MREEERIKRRQNCHRIEGTLASIDDNCNRHSIGKLGVVFPTAVIPRDIHDIYNVRLECFSDIVQIAVKKEVPHFHALRGGEETCAVPLDVCLDL